MKNKEIVNNFVILIEHIRSLVFICENDINAIKKEHEEYD